MCMPFLNKMLRRNKRNRNRDPTPAPSAVDLTQLTPEEQKPEETVAEQTAAASAPAPAAAPAPTPETIALARAQVTPAAMAMAMAANFAASGRPSRTLSTITSVDSIIANNLGATVQVQEAHNVSNDTGVDASTANDGGLPPAASTASSSGRKKTWLEFFGMSKKKSSIDSL